MLRRVRLQARFAVGARDDGDERVVHAAGRASHQIRPGTVHGSRVFVPARSHRRRKRRDLRPRLQVHPRKRNRQSTVAVSTHRLVRRELHVRRLTLATRARHQAPLPEKRLERRQRGDEKVQDESRGAGAPQAHGLRRRRRLSGHHAKQGRVLDLQARVRGARHRTSVEKMRHVNRRVVI